MQRLYQLCVCLALIAAAGCSRTPESDSDKTPAARAEKDEGGPTHAATAKQPAKLAEEGEREENSDFVTLSTKQLQAAGIEVAAVRRNFTGAIEAPAVIVSNPQGAATVSSSVSGRVVEVRKNIGESVARGDTLALIESREVAQFSADVAIARRQRELAEANFGREERLYAEKVSSRQEYETARASLAEMRSRQRLAEQQLGSAGGSIDQSGRMRLRAPIAGVVTARQIAQGDVVEANAKLFEVADLRTLSVELSLAPADAARIAIGATVEVSTEGRTSTGKIAYLSPVVDPATRQVRALASLPNPNAAWRIGETVRASIALSGAGKGQLAIPRSAVQTVEDKPSVFVREKDGFSIRHVALDKPSAAYVIVQSGLDGSEQIAVTNTYVLKAELGKGEAGDDHD